MKKTVLRLFSLILVLALAVPAIPAYGASSANKNEIFSYITRTLGYNSAAACGLMANIEKESDFDPTCVGVDSNGLLSGGLFQWNGGRFTNLRNYCDSHGYNYLSVEGQMMYLKAELQTSSYKKINSYMKSVPNTAEGAYNAAHYWCYYFEIPANRGTKAAQRGDLAVSKYWPMFAPSFISKPKLKSASHGKIVLPGKSLKVSWNTVSGNATGYVIYLAKKAKGGFDWAKAKVYTKSISKKSISFNTSKLKNGRYAVRVYGINQNNLCESEPSNLIKFNIGCPGHDYYLKSTKNPTFSREGSKLFVCSECGDEKTELIKRLSSEDFEASKVENFRVAEKTSSSISLAWSGVRLAEEYIIYKKTDSGWKKLASLEPSVREYKAKKLTSGEKYTFRIKAVADCLGDTVETEYSSASARVSLKKLKITDVDKMGSRAVVEWNGNSSADGYVLYKSLKSTSGFEAVAEVDFYETFYTVTGLKSGKKAYFMVKYYTVTSNGGRIYSEPSNVVSVKM